MTKKLLSFLLTVSFLLSLCCFAVGADSATFVINDGSIVIKEAEDEVNLAVEQNGQTTLLSPSTLITVVGNGVTTNNITVKNNVTVSIVINNVRIVSPGFLRAPICIDNGETVHLTVIGSNILIADDYMAGLQTSRRSSLTVDGNGTLYAAGGRDAAGIGGGWRSATPGSDAGSIVIGGDVTVIAEGGENGAGIGGGIEGSAKEIAIETSATVSAVGGSGAAGIGSGSGGNVRQISVAGGSESVVFARGGSSGAGIGSGDGGSVTSIIIAGNGRIRAYGGSDAAAVGSGSQGSVSRIKIAGKNELRALAGSNSAAVGTGYKSSGKDITVTENAGVFALGDGGAGIGSGAESSLETITIEQNAYIDSFGGDGAAGIGSGKGSKIGSVTISGNADVLCIGGKDGAGLGGGSGSVPEEITVAGNTKLIAAGGLCGAGIGSGSGAAYKAITISGAANVRAQGGNFGAGIGSGARETAATETPTAKIVITDQSVVETYGGKSASGIGGGVFGAGSILEVSQNAKVTSVADNTVTIKGGADGLSIASPDASPIKLGDYAVDSIPPLPAKPSFIEDPESPTVTPPASGDSEDFPYIVYAPSSSSFDVGQKKFDTLGIDANAAGNGAGCTVAGSIHISGGASLNGQVGDVTLTLVLGDGATDMVITLVKNASYTLPEVVTKTGYTFRGWYDDYNLTIPVSGTVQVTGNRLIYAAWTAVQVELSDSQITPAVKDVFYSYKFETSSGTASTSFVVTMGEVPAGMTLSGDGVLSGTPAVAGKYTFTVAYLNSNGTSGAREVTLAVHTNNTYTFIIKTGTADGAETKAQIMMSFEFTDRLTGEKRVTQTVNLTDFMRAYYDAPFRAGAEESLPLVFEPNVGEPENIILTCDSDDGWFCESVRVVSEGNGAAEAFQKDFEINAWIGREQNVKAGKIFLIIVAVLFGLIALAAAAFVLLARNPKTRRFLKEKGFFRNEKQK